MIAPSGDTGRARADAVCLLGVRYDNVTRAEAVELLERFVAERGPRHICTPNFDHIMRARVDPEFRDILAHADLTVADGMGVVYASRILKSPLTENVTGRLLVEAYAERGAPAGRRIFLLGGRSTEDARRAAERLAADHPGLAVCGWYVPPHAEEFGEDESARMVAAVNAAHPDVLLVCLGAPKQEKWIARNRHRLDVPVSMGVGATLDFLAGRVRLPPRWMTRVGLEWLFRLVQEPRRLAQRYLVRGAQFAWLVLRERVLGPRAPGPIGAPPPDT